METEETSSKTKSLFENVEQILSMTTQMQKIAKQLLQFKQQKKKMVESQELQLTCNQQMLSAINLRQTHRQLHQSIQEEQKQIQEEKDKIDKFSVSLESFKYKKQTLINNINICKSYKLQNLEKTNLSQSVLNQNLIQDKQKIINILNGELKERKELKEIQQSSIQQLDKLMQNHDQTTKVFFKELPVCLVKLADSLKPIQQIFKIPTLQNPQQILLQKQLDGPIRSIFEFFQKAIDTNFMDLEIEKISNQQLAKYSVNLLTNKILKDQLPQPYKIQFVYHTSLNTILIYEEQDTKQNSYILEDILEKVQDDICGEYYSVHVKDKKQTLYKYYWTQMIQEYETSLTQNQEPEKIQIESQQPQTQQSQQQQQFQQQQQQQLLQPEQFIQKLMKSLELTFSLKNTFEQLKQNKVAQFSKFQSKFILFDKITYEQFKTIQTQEKLQDKKKNDEKEEGEIQEEDNKDKSQTQQLKDKQQSQQQLQQQSQYQQTENQNEEPNKIQFVVIDENNYYQFQLENATQNVKFGALMEFPKKQPQKVKLQFLEALTGAFDSKDPSKKKKNVNFVSKLKKKSDELIEKINQNLESDIDNSYIQIFSEIISYVDNVLIKEEVGKQENKQ